MLKRFYGIYIVFLIGNTNKITDFYADNVKSGICFFDLSKVYTGMEVYYAY